MLALVSYRCCNKYPHAEWLKMAQTVYLTGLDVGSLKRVSVGQNPGVGRAASLPEAAEERRGESIPLPFPVSGGHPHS